MLHASAIGASVTVPKLTKGVTTDAEGKLLFRCAGTEVEVSL
jgi:hypothetical protein